VGTVGMRPTRAKIDAVLADTRKAKRACAVDRVQAGELAGADEGHVAMPCANLHAAKAIIELVGGDKGRSASRIRFKDSLAPPFYCWIAYAISAAGFGDGCKRSPRPDFQSWPFQILLNS
jgi:hypothetical protein